MDWTALITALLEIFQNCNTARRTRAMGNRGRLPRTLALRRAARQTNQAWDLVRVHEDAMAFLADGFDEADVEDARVLVAAASTAEIDTLRCGNEE